MSGTMYSACDRARSVVLLVCALWAGGLQAAPDSLTVKDKGRINSYAEGLFENYISMLNTIATLPREDAESQATVEDFIKSYCQPGPDQVFISPDAQIEDNIDPATTATTPGRNRKLKEYANDLLLLFKNEEGSNNPVEARVLMKGEPGISEQVYTRILYEVRFSGAHVTNGTAYVKHQRVLDLVASKDSKGGWRVLISADSWFDPAQGFTEYALERTAANSTQDPLASAQLEEYRNSAREAREAAERERAERKQAYANAIARGQELVKQGDFDNGILIYEQAKTFDPLAIDPLILINAAKRAKLEKEVRDRKAFEELLAKAGKLHALHEHPRALASAQEAAQFQPDDPRIKPLIDSLARIVREKSDREAAYNAQNYGGMLEETQRLLKDPRYRDDPEIKVLQAKCLIKLNRRSDALVALNAVILKEPTFAEARLLRADLLEKGGDKEKLDAIEDYLTVKNHDVWDMTSYHHYAMLRCYQQKRCKEADGILREALKHEPGNVLTHYLLGYVNGRSGSQEYRVSLDHLNEAIARDSSCAKCHLERGITLLEMDSADAADRAVRRARALDLPEEHAERAKQLAAACLEGAKKLAENQGYTSADRLFLQACVLDPGNPEYRLLKARNLMAIDRHGDAIKDLDVHINSTPAPYAALLDRAACELATGRYADALADVERIRQNHITTLEENANLVAGKAAYGLNDLAKAESHLRSTLKVNKRNPGALRLMTVISLKSDRPQEARNYARSAVEADPLNPENHFNLGMALQAVKDEDGSVASFEKAIELGYDREEAYKQMGRSCMLSAKYKAAIEHFERRMRLKDDVEVPRWMADCHFALQQYPEALGVLSKLLAVHPEVESRSDFLAQIAMLHVVTGDYTVAKNFIDKAIAVDNVHKGTLLARAAYYWKTDRQQEAVDELHLLVQRGLITEAEMRKMPVLRDVPDTKLWKSKVSPK